MDGQPERKEADAKGDAGADVGGHARRRVRELQRAMVALHDHAEKPAEQAPPPFARPGALRPRRISGRPPARLPCRPLAYGPAERASGQDVDSRVELDADALKIRRLAAGVWVGHHVLGSTGQ